MRIYEEYALDDDDDDEVYEGVDALGHPILTLLNC